MRMLFVIARFASQRPEVTCGTILCNPCHIPIYAATVSCQRDCSARARPSSHGGSMVYIIDQEKCEKDDHCLEACPVAALERKDDGSLDGSHLS